MLERPRGWSSERYLLAVSELTVTPNEIARRLGVTGLRFRNWLRDQKAAGHPLLAGHEYRTRYLFTAADAEQLEREFAEQRVRRGSAPKRASATERKRTRRDTSRAGHPSREGQPRNYPRSEDPGHRVTVEWRGEEIETLADLLRPGLRAVVVGINPAPKSVAAGHYYHGTYGQRFFDRLRRAGGLPDGDGDAFEDDRAFAAGIGFTDVVKRPSASADEVSAELADGRNDLAAKLADVDVPLVIFAFKAAAETLLGPLPKWFYGVVPRRRIGKARVFVMPGPTAPTAEVDDAVKKLKRALRSTG
jgi:TDG/mug DNA glycosylase family protein